MRILLLGKTGQVGWELQRTLAPLGDVFAPSRSELDLADLSAIPALVQQVNPNVIVSAAAYSEVDQAETETEQAYVLNQKAPAVLAAEARQADAVLVHYSTDYVFDGKAEAPYTEDDETNPVNVYGESKLAGERAIQQVGGTYIILRTSCVYSLRRDCFVTKILTWARRQTQLRIVTDQIGNPTWCRMLAETTAHMLQKGLGNRFDWFQERAGIYHLAGRGSASRLDWARTVLQLDPDQEEHRFETLLPAKTDDFPTPAKRPLYTALNCERFFSVFGLRLPLWEDALHMAMAEK